MSAALPGRNRPRSLIAEAKADPGIFEAMRKSIARRARNQKAPYNSIAAVEAARSLPCEDGVRRERDLFDELENSAEVRALRYAFFAEREVAKLPDEHLGFEVTPRVVMSKWLGELWPEVGDGVTG